MSQVQTLQVQPAAMELESQRQVEKSLKDLKTKVEVCVCEYTCVCVFVCVFVQEHDSLFHLAGDGAQHKVFGGAAR